MQAALEYPEQVAKLVVVDIAPRQYPSLHDTILDALTSLTLNQYSSRQAVDDALSNKIPQLAVRQFLMKNLARNEDGSFRWKLNLEVIRANYGEVVREVSSQIPFAEPTLVIRSTKSSYVTESDFPDFKRLFPTYKVVDFDTGHWVHAEAPEDLTKAVTGFLRS